MLKTALLLLALLAAPFSQEDAVPLTIGVVGNAISTDGTDSARMLQGAQLAAEQWNARGGVDGALVEVVAFDTSDLRDTVKQLAASGATAFIGPLDPDQLAEAHRAAGDKLVCIGPQGADGMDEILDLFRNRFRTPRIAFVHDKSRSAKALAKQLDKTLPHPFAVVMDAHFKTKPKDLAEDLAEFAPQVVLIDGESAQVAEALSGLLKDVNLPVVLTPRCRGAALDGVEGQLIIALGRSPLTMPQRGPLVTAFREQHGDPGFGVCEGLDCMEFLLRAIDAADDRKASKVKKALAELHWEGTRGNTRYDAKTGNLRAPMALWSLAGGTLTPHTPPVVPDDIDMSASTSTGLPDPEFGEAFAERRSTDFVFEEDTQWVIFSWGTPEESTIDDDLAQLGLSTSGASPLLDHLVKEELMTRMLSITASKFRRALDGGPVPGVSLSISFSTFMPPKAKNKRIWNAVVAGDHEFAGGMAFGHRAEIYSVFIRRTIYQPHALTPPLGPEDLTYLDGSYRHGTERKSDLRADFIRSLINAYAGSMSLTAAHEIGHLAGLGHITDDEAGIMNVEEGAGLDYRDAHFTEFSFGLLVDNLGLTGK
jgi:ABC-type branched-subunit amino acid transport system substrate-binding protein